MTYREAIAWLYSTQTSGIKLGLENITRLLRAIGFDDRRARILHIAGTNGKGSVCAMLDALCRQRGLRTGLYTSPHLITYRERIRLSGEMIPESAVADGLTRLRTLTADWEPPPTFFEYTTALALDWFQQQRAEVIVLETGLGGRLDSTNAVRPAVTAITPISFDHMQYLGSTLAAIAGEKAGILKPGIPALSSPQPPEAAAALRQRAEALGIPLRFIDAPVKEAVNLPGPHQKLNAALAVATLEAAGLHLPAETLTEGLCNVQWPGRFQRLQLPGHQHNQQLILDGAHNEASAAALAATWREEYGTCQPTLILSSLSDKDVTALAQQLLPLAARVITVAVNNPRTRTATDLAGQLRTIASTLTPPPDSSLTITPAGSVAEALALGASSNPAAPLLVTGSLFLVGDVLAFLQGAESEFPSAQ